VQALELDGDISVFDAATRQALLLNSTASDVWRLLDGEHTLDDIVHLLAAAYGQPADAIRADVQRTVATLAGAGLLAGPTGPPGTPGHGAAQEPTGGTLDEPAGSAAHEPRYGPAGNPAAEPAATADEPVGTPAAERRGGTGGPVAGAAAGTAAG
jgi:hypothetical protein